MEMRHQAQLAAEEQERNKKLKEYKSHFSSVSHKKKPDYGFEDSYDTRLR